MCTRLWRIRRYLKYRIRMRSKEEKRIMAEVITRSRPASLAGMLWLAGWLFTIAFAKLVWWKAVLGLAI